MATLQEIIREKLSRLDSVPESLYTQVDKEQAALLEILLDQLNRLKTKDGKILLSNENLLLIEEIGQVMQTSMFEGDYIKSVQQFALEFDQQARVNRSFFDKAFGGFTDKEIFNSTLRAAKVRAVDQLNGGAIAERFIQPLKDSLQANVTSEAGISQVARQMTEFMVGNKEVDGKLLNWVKQTASDNYAISDREYTRIIASDIGVEWFRYSGGEIPTTRCFCEERNGKIFHIREIESWGNDPGLWAKNPDLDCKGGGMIQGTNQQNIFVFLGGYNCRHSLIPIDESDVPIAVMNRVISKGFIQAA